jgi:plasmid stabilization system protein ParE
MALKIRITPEAESDLRAIGDYVVSQHAPKAARRFIKSIRRQIASLKTFPEAYGLAPEAAAAGIDLRQLMHGMYRVLYTVEGKAVTIHAVRHGARRPLREDELPRPKQ